jgi:hypothetical protein
MKAKKSLISIALILLSVSAHAYDFGGYYYGNIYYDITSSTEPYTVAVAFNTSRYPGYSGWVIIPETVTSSSGITYTVTSIGNEAFYICPNLWSVTIPSSVTSIGDKAFIDCSSLTSVTIPSSVTSIGERAFGGCTGLKDIALEDGTATLSFSGGAFAGCPVESVYLGRDIPYYSSGSPFSGNTTLRSLTVGNSVTSIGYSAFYNCSGLTKLTIGNSVTSIGEWAFYNCSGLTKLIIPNSVTSIGNDAFRKCTGLTAVTIGNSVTSIGY